MADANIPDDEGVMQFLIIEEFKSRQRIQRLEKRYLRSATPLFQGVISALLTTELNHSQALQKLMIDGPYGSFNS